MSVINKECLSIRNNGNCLKNELKKLEKKNVNQKCCPITKIGQLKILTNYRILTLDITEKVGSICVEYATTLTVTNARIVCFL